MGKIALLFFFKKNIYIFMSGRLQRTANWIFYPIYEIWLSVLNFHVMVLIWLGPGEVRE